MKLKSLMLSPMPSRCQVTGRQTSDDRARASLGNRLTLMLFGKSHAEIHNLEAMLANPIELQS